MKVNREQLIEAAKTYTDFKSKYNISAFNEKTNFFGLSFYCFFRLQIYEAIAAICWQSASYVLDFSLEGFFVWDFWLFVLKNEMNW